MKTYSLIQMLISVVGTAVVTSSIFYIQCSQKISIPTQEIVKTIPEEKTKEKINAKKIELKAKVDDKKASQEITTQGIQEDYPVEYTYTPDNHYGDKYNVSSVSELQRVIAKAKGGDIIILKKGIYKNVVIYGIESNGIPITIEAGAGEVIIENIKINHSTGLLFKHILFKHTKLEGEQDWTRIVTLNHSKDISIIKSKFIGSDDGDYFNDVTGIGTKFSENIVIYKNHFSHLSKGIILDGGKNDIISQNTFTKINIDGVNIAGGSENILIENNNFSQFYTCDIFNEKECKNHPDFIQVYNDTGKKSNENIRILSNNLIQATGTPLQSIFLQTNNPDYNNKNILIENNLIINSHAHGITLYSSDNIEINNNTLIPTHQEETNTVRIPTINIFSSSNILTKNNISKSPITNKLCNSLRQENNIIITDDAQTQSQLIQTQYYFKRLEFLEIQK